MNATDPTMWQDARRVLTIGSAHKGTARFSVNSSTLEDVDEYEKFDLSKLKVYQMFLTCYMTRLVQASFSMRVEE